MPPFGYLHCVSGVKHPNTPKILAAAALNGLDVEVPPGFEMGKTNKTPEYLAKFPLGKIPSFETASGFALTESNAIAYYVAESGPRKEQLLGSTPEERGLVHQWSLFNSEHLQRTVLDLVRPILGFGTYDAKLEAAANVELKRWLQYLEGQLKNRTWLLPNYDLQAGPSLADLSVGQGLRLGFKLYIDAEMRKEYPNIMAWWNRLLAVPEVEKMFDGNSLIEKRKELK